MKTKKLTLEEIKEFIQNSNHEDLITNEYDESGNYYEEEVRQKDGKFYTVNYCNGVISPVRPKKRDQEDWYELNEVFPHKQIIEITNWTYKP